MSDTPLRWALCRAFAFSAALSLTTEALGARDTAPVVSTDPETHIVTVTGPHHPYKPPLNLIRTDWWLHASITAGIAGDPMLMVGVDLPGWAELDSATGSSGAKLAVAVLARGRSLDLHGEDAERVAITLPRALVAAGARSGLTVTVTGKQRSFQIVVPAKAILSFEASYASAIANAATASSGETPTPVDVGPTPPAPSAWATTGTAKDAAISAPSLPTVAPMPQPTAVPAMAAPPADGSTTAASDDYPVAALGIVIAPSAFGAMLVSVSRDSRLASLGAAEGDFITGVDGTSIKGLSGAEMAARIGSPRVKVLNCMADGDVTIR